MEQCMSLWKAFRILADAGAIFTVIGELLSGLGRVKPTQSGGTPQSQDSSNSTGAEDEKPEDEDYYRDY